METYYDLPSSLLSTVSMTLSPPLKAVYVPRIFPSESLLPLGYVPRPKTTGAPAIFGNGGTSSGHDGLNRSYRRCSE